MIQKDARPTKSDSVITVLNGKIIWLDHKNEEDRLLEKMRRAFNSGNRDLEQDLVNEYTKRGLFYGAGRYRDIK